MMGFRERLLGRVAERGSQPAVVIRALASQLQRLAGDIGAEGLDLIAHRPSVPTGEAVAYVRAAQRRLEAFAAWIFAGEDGVPAPSADTRPPAEDADEILLQVLDALALAADEPEESEAYAAGKALLGAVIKHQAALAGADVLAAQAAAAYDKGMDAPRLVANVVARSGLAQRPEVFEVGGHLSVTPADLAQQPVDRRAALASAEGPADLIGLRELARRWASVDAWTIEGTDVRFALRVSIDAKLLLIEATAGSGPIDGYRFRLTSTAGQSPAEAVARAGRAALTLPSQVDVNALLLEAAAPGADFQECVNA